MKRILIIIVIAAAALFGLIYADSKTDNGIIEELTILLTPDPMR